MSTGGAGRRRREAGRTGGAPGHQAVVRAAQPRSQLLDLLSYDDGVLLPDLLSGFCLVVIGAGVHV